MTVECGDGAMMSWWILWFGGFRKTVANVGSYMVISRKSSSGHLKLEGILAVTSLV